MDDQTDETPALAKVSEVSGSALGTQDNDTTAPQSTAKQRLAILSYLQQGNRLTTLTAREELGIMHPAARVMELRKAGYKIVTHIRTGPDITGTKHSVAEYVLVSGSEVA